jgi:hypothetical protein
MRTAELEDQIRLARSRESGIKRITSWASPLAGFEVTAVGRFSTDPRGGVMPLAVALAHCDSQGSNGLTNFAEFVLKYSSPFL